MVPGGLPNGETAGSFLGSIEAVSWSCSDSSLSALLGVHYLNLSKDMPRNMPGVIVHQATTSLCQKLALLLGYIETFKVPWSLVHQTMFAPFCISRS